MLPSTSGAFCQESKSLTKNLEIWDDFRMSKDIYSSFKSGLAVTDLATALKTLETVYILDLSKAKLTSIPNDIVKLKNLEDLKLSGNSISDWQLAFETLSRSYQS